jgi:hypothetical protein
MSKDGKIKLLIDRKFLDTLKEVSKLYGYDGDYIAISEFVQYLFVLGHVELPDLKPYESDIDDIITETPIDKKEVTMDDIVLDLKKCKIFIDFLVTVKETFGLNLIWSKTESWLEYFGKEVPNSRKIRFDKEQQIKDLIFISGL